MFNNLLPRSLWLSCILVFLLGSVVAADEHGKAPESLSSFDDKGNYNTKRFNNKCDSSVALCSPKEVRKAFEATEEITRNAGTFNIPALVSDDIFIRAITSIPGDLAGGDPDHVKETYSLTRPGAGKWFVFVGGHDLVEKSLIAGQKAATKVLRNFGYGSSFNCSKDIFYWLIVFRKTKGITITDAVYKNLQEWMDHVYGVEAPHLTESVLKSLETERFTEITECPVDPKTGAAILDKCGPEFSEAVKDFRNLPLCSDSEALTYTPYVGCPTDSVLASFGNQPDAVQIRAYLYTAGSFFEYYTGYGYSANWYDEPIGHEYWTDNAWIKDLPEAELLAVQCNDAKAP